MEYKSIVHVDRVVYGKGLVLGHRVARPLLSLKVGLELAVKELAVVGILVLGHFVHIVPEHGLGGVQLAVASVPCWLAVLNIASITVLMVGVAHPLLDGLHGSVLVRTRGVELAVLAISILTILALVLLGEFLGVVVVVHLPVQGVLVIRMASDRVIGSPE